MTKILSKNNVRNLKEGQEIFFIEDGMLYHVVKLGNKKWKSAYSSQNLAAENPKIKSLIKALTAAFESGMEDGRGADLWTDEDGKTHLEVDSIRVRDTLAVKEMLRQQVRATNGNIMCTSTGKIRAIKPKINGGLGLNSAETL